MECIYGSVKYKRLHKFYVKVQSYLQDGNYSDPNLIPFILAIILPLSDLCRNFNTRIDRMLETFGVDNVSGLLVHLANKFIILLAIVGVTFFSVNSKKSYQEYERLSSPLFHHSSVSEYMYGELDKLNNEVLLSDLSLVLYYAPWDRQCKEFKPTFLSAASYYYEQIKFASINCWYPEGRCRKELGLSYYPVVVLYARLPSNQQLVSIPYTGPLIEQQLFKFLSKAIKPLTYVPNASHLHELYLKNQAVVLGCFRHNVPSLYNYFYYASLIGLHYSYENDVAYAASFNLSLCGSNSSTIQLRTWNDTFEYPSDSKKNSRNITDWIQKKISFNPYWIKVTEIRSVELSKLANRGPFLVYFMPDNAYTSLNSEYIMLRSLVLEYHNCNNSTNVNKEVEELKVFANNIIFGNNTLNDCKAKVYRCDLEDNKYAKYIADDNYTFLSQKNRKQCSSACQNSSHKNGISWTPDFEEHTIIGPNENYSIKTLETWYYDDLHKKTILSHNLSPIRKVSSLSSTSITGLACKNNTLSFVAIDSLQKADFSVRPGVWIVDAPNEVHYKLNDISRENIAQFIFNYTYGLLYRNRISESIISTQLSNEILELNAINYNEVTGEIGRAFVVLHYYPACGACKAMSSAFLSCSSLFSGLNITFSRINVLKNDLPWSLTFGKVPFILYHPYERKTYTEFYEENETVSVRSLATFILSNLNEEYRLKFAKNQRKFTENVVFL